MIETKPSSTTQKRPGAVNCVIKIQASKRTYQKGDGWSFYLLYFKQSYRKTEILLLRLPQKDCNRVFYTLTLKLSYK